MNTKTIHTGRRCTYKAFPYTNWQRGRIWVSSVLRAISTPPPKDKFLEVEVFKGDKEWDDPLTMEIVEQWFTIPDSIVKPAQPESPPKPPKTRQ